MFAIVDIAGQQLNVAPSKRVHVPRIDAEIGKTVTFDRILLFSDDKSVKIGKPFIAGLAVQARVLAHVKDEKVIVFKKKRRKGYRVRRGHRQQYTEVEITNIG